MRALLSKARWVLVVALIAIAAWAIMAGISANQDPAGVAARSKQLYDPARAFVTTQGVVPTKLASMARAALDVDLWVIHAKLVKAITDQKRADSLWACRFFSDNTLDAINQGRAAGVDSNTAVRCKAYLMEEVESLTPRWRLLGGACTEVSEKNLAFARYYVELQPKLALLTDMPPLQGVRYCL